MKIALLTSELSLEHIREVIPEFSKRCEIDSFVFHDRTCLSKLYNDIKDGYDGFLFSGWIVFASISSVCKIEKPYECFSPAEGDYYRTLFAACAENPDIPLNRFLTDKAGTERGFTDVMPEYNHCYVMEPKDAIEKFDSDRSALSIDLGTQFYVQQCLDSIKERNISVVVSGLALLGKAVPKEVQFYHIYPGRDSMAACIEKLINRIDSGNITAMLSVNGLLTSSTDISIIEQTVSRFIWRSGLDCLITRESDGLRLVISNPDFQRITLKQTDCLLSHELLNCEITDFFLGWGLGYDMTDAQKKAQKALQIAKHSGLGSSFIVMGNGSVVGPMLSSNPLSFSANDDDGSIAMSYTYDISRLNVKRVRALIEKTHNNIYSGTELAAELNIHPRSARRILAKLALNGGAELLPSATGTKGRPELHYRITLR